MQYETDHILTKWKVLGYEISDYFPKFLSYLVDLIIILSIVTLLLVYIFNEPAIIYLFPYYYLYTHNSIHRLVLNSDGLDFFILFLIVSFIYHVVSSYLAYSPGSIILNMRTKMVTGGSKGDTTIPPRKRFILQLRYCSLRSIFLTIPFLPIFDNMFAKKGRKLTERYLGTVVVHPLRLKKVRIHGPLDRNTDQIISKISPKMISYPEFLEYYGLRTAKDGLWFNRRRGEADGRAIDRSEHSSNTEVHLQRIGSVVSSREFFLSNLEDKDGEGSNNQKDSFWKVKKRYRLDYIFVASLLYFVPFIVAILVGWHITNAQTFYTPPPLASNKYVPTSGLAQVQQGIFNQNFSIDLRFLILGGITLFFLPYLGIYSSIYLPSVAIASSLHSQYWYYIFYAIFPHLFVETFGYVFGIVSGLYLSKLLIEVFISYSRGADVNRFLGLVYHNLFKFAIMFIISIGLILSASYMEAYVTSYILNHFYFIH